jgi:WD40 repeat protein
VRDVAITSDGRGIAVVDSQDVVHVAHHADARWFSAQPAWTPFAVRARTVSFSHDGLLLALCSDSTLWLYSIEHKRWYCILTGTADLNTVAASADSRRAAVFDSDGHIIMVDLHSVKETLSGTLQGTTL